MNASKRFGALLLVLSLALSLLSPALAAQEPKTSAANTLYTLGLFSGTGTDAAGNPNFDLDRTPTRAEAVVMLVRLLGKEAEAKAGQWQTPFTDTAAYAWALPYVGYAYANGLAQGNGTLFDGGSSTTATQYLTFVLRALGYDSKTDFQWDKASAFADSIGLTFGEYSGASQPFTRGSVAAVSLQALSLTKKGDTVTLLQQLVDGSAVTEDKVVSAGLQALLRDPSTPATRADLAHFLVNTFPIKNYGGAITLDNIKDVDSSTKYADDILLAMNTGLLGGSGDGSFGPSRAITNAEVASVLVRFLLQSGCDLSAYTTPINSPLIVETTWYYNYMTYAINLGIFSGQVDPMAYTPYSTLNDNLVSSIMSLPDSNKIGSVSVHTDAFSLEYLEVGGKLYKVDRKSLSVANIGLNGAVSLYVPAPTAVTNVDADYTSSLTSNSLYDFLAYTLGDYTIKNSTNPYISGIISPTGRFTGSGPVKIEKTDEYTSIDKKKVLTTITVSGKSLSSNDMPEVYSSVGEINGITYINGYLKADELLNYFGIKKTVTIETRDDIQVLCIR